jgi:hypothetical protein
MAKKYLSPLNLLNLTSDPGTAAEGDFYWNSSTNRLRIYFDGAWADVSSNTAFTNAANTFTTAQTITPATSLTGLTINAAASSKGLIVKANATTPGNLQEWQNSSSVVLASIDANGQGSFKSTTLTASSSSGSALTLVAAGGQTADLLTTAGGAKIPAAGNYFIAPGIYSTFLMYADSGSATQVAVRIKGFASQTANLTEWQNSAGTVLSYTSASGNFFVPGIRDVANTGSYIDMSAAGAVSINTRSTTNIGLIVKGVASQTANLQEWQNSAGTILGGVTNSGYGYFGPSYIGGQFSINPAVAGNRALVIRGATSQSANLTEWQDNAGTILARVQSNGVIRTDFAAAPNDAKHNSILMLAGTDATLGANQLNLGIYPSATGSSRYAFIESGDAADWRPIVFFPTATATTTGRIGIGTTSPAAKIHTSATSATSIPLIAQGAASQSADLQQWRDSSATILAQMTSGGFMNATGYRQIGGNSNAFGTSTIAGSVTAFGPGGNAAIVPIVVRGAASQTARLQEWQDSTGAVKSSISADGTAFSTTQVITEYLTDAASTTPYLRLTSNTIQVLNRNVGYVNLAVRGFASQTADLQQWQDSSGNVLTRINANGIVAIGGIPRAMNLSLIPTLQVEGTTASSSYAMIMRNSNDVNYPRFTLAKSRGTAIGGLTTVASGDVLGSIEYQGTDGTNLNIGARIEALVEGTVSAGVVPARLSLYTSSSSGTSTERLRIDSAGLATFYNDVTVAGNLTINGTTTNINTTNLVVEDKNIILGDVTTPSNTTADGGGITLKAAADKTFNWVNATDRWTSNVGIEATSFVRTSGTSAQFLKADGSVDSSTYLTTGTASSTYAPLNSPAFIGAATFGDGTTTEGRITSSGDAFYVQAGISNADTTAKLTFARFGTASSNVSQINAYSDLSTFYGAVTSTGQIQSTLGGTASTAQIYLNGTTSNRIDFNTNGAAAPAFTTRSVGTKIVLYPEIGASAVDYGIGIENSNIWFSTPLNTSARGFKWYGGTTERMSLRGDGTLSLNSTSLTLGNGSVTHQLGIVSGAAANVALVIRAAASQTGSLTQWQDSSGNLLGFVNSLVGFRYARFGTDTAFTDATVLRVNAFSTSVATAQIKAIASQTANLQEWQNSAGTILSGISASGYGFFGTTGAASAAITAKAPLDNFMGIIVRPFSASQTANLQEWQNNSGTAVATMSAAGAFTAITKSFDIPHPTKENMRLRYGSLEGPENGVYVRGRSKQDYIALPDHWIGLVDEDTITVNITPIGKKQDIYVDSIEDNKVYLGGKIKEYFFTVYGERKDVDKLLVEY